MFGKSVLETFFEENKGKYIRVFLSGGFQLRGKLEAYDDFHMRIYTDAYNSVFQSVIIPLSAVSTYVAM